MAPREISVGKHTDWSTVLVVCSPESLTYTQRESLKLKKIIQVYNIFFCTSLANVEEFYTTGSAGAHGKRKADEIFGEELDQRQK